MFRKCKYSFKAFRLICTYSVRIPLLFNENQLTTCVIKVRLIRWPCYFTVAGHVLSCLKVCLCFVKIVVKAFYFKDYESHLKRFTQKKVSNIGLLSV